jgi:hypothetical protein
VSNLNTGDIHVWKQKGVYEVAFLYEKEEKMI